MKTMTALALVAALAASGDDGAARQSRFRRQIEREGGIVTNVTKGDAIRVVLAQGRVGMEALAPTILQMQGLLDKDVELGSMPAKRSFQETVAAARSVPGTAAAIVLLEDGCMPTVTVAPEQGWAAVNVKALAADGADAERLCERVRKELWRALVWVLAESHETNCVMRRAGTLAELDAIGTQVPSPDPMFRLVNGVGRRGIRSIMRATYRDACEEGWAPAPTNDVQKAIWEKVQAEKERGPAKPITIPPPKK